MQVIHLCHENICALSPIDYGSQHLLLHEQCLLAYCLNHPFLNGVSLFVFDFSNECFIVVKLVSVQHKYCMQLFESVKLEDLF